MIHPDNESLFKTFGIINKSIKPNDHIFFMDYTLVIWIEQFLGALSLSLSVNAFGFGYLIYQTNLPFC